MQTAKPKMVSVVCAVDTLTVGNTEYRGVKDKKVEVPEHLVPVLQAHKFVKVSAEGKVNEPVS